VLYIKPVCFNPAFSVQPIDTANISGAYKAVMVISMAAFFRRKL